MQLPAPPMLMFDRITTISDGGGASTRASGLFDDLWFFDVFIGDPVMPGCLGLDAMWQLVGFWLGWTGARARAAHWVRIGPVHGASRKDVKLVTYRVDIKKVIRRGINLGIANATGTGGRSIREALRVDTSIGVREGRRGSRRPSQGSCCNPTTSAASAARCGYHQDRARDQ